MVPPHLCPASLDPLKQQSELDLKITIFLKKEKWSPKKRGKKKKIPHSPQQHPENRNHRAHGAPAAQQHICEFREWNLNIQR